MRMVRPSKSHTPALTFSNISVSTTNMHPEAPTIPRPPQPDPARDRPAQTVPERLAALLHLVRVLLGHGRRLTETATAQAASPCFATLGAVLGTHDTLSILARVRRGILRLIALENYLLARAHKGREAAFVPPRARAPAGQTPVPARPRRRPFDPDALHIPTLQELEAEVRRRPIGRTIAYICMDLAVIPGFCTGEFWNGIFQTLQWYGGSFTGLHAVRARREQTYQRERDQRPDTWDWDWRDLRRPTVRQVLGYLIGEEPPDPLPA